jgi:hypothetical protein
MDAPPRESNAGGFGGFFGIFTFFRYKLDKTLPVVLR